MVFADLKNDFVFRRIFAAHPDILRGLLNDLLERTGDRAIESVEYLPSEQLPLIPGLKLSILDVRCKERGGGIFIVEMQLVHMAGFLNRMVYNGSKAYVSQLKAGDSYTKLVDVVAIAICDFELWPDAEQDKLNEARMPMCMRRRFWDSRRQTHGEGDRQVPRSPLGTGMRGAPGRPLKYRECGRGELGAARNPSARPVCDADAYLTSRSKVSNFDLRSWLTATSEVSNFGPWG